MDLRIAAAERRNTLIVVAAMAAMFFIWMPGEFLAGDPYSWREEARSILQSGELHVTEQVVPLFGEPGQYLVRNPRNGLHYSKYGIANSLLAVPPLLVQRALYGALPPPGGAPSLLIFNLWQIGYGALLAAILYALSGRYSRRAGVRAVFIVAAFFCTSLWFYQRAQSSEIYQTILFTALFIALTRFLRPLLENGPRGVTPRDWLCLAAAWACAAVLVLTRASYGLLLPVVVLLGAGCALRGRPWRELLGRRLLAALLVPPALIVALFGWVNYAKFGAPWLTGYHAWRTDLVTPTLRLVDGLWGYLFSIRFSMFVSFPLLVFALAGARRFTERHRLDAIAAAALFVPTLLLLSSLPSWAGDWSYGPCLRCPSSFSQTSSSTGSAPGPRAPGSPRGSSSWPTPRTSRAR